MKNSVLYFLLFYSVSFLGQKKLKREISFLTDNDLYVSSENDRYYTSGIFLGYKYVSNKKTEKLEKRIYEWKLGHEMYTPFRASVQSVFLHDRPFAGYLYANFGIHRFYKNEKTLSTAIQVGTIGTKSFARELQVFIHNIYGFREPTGWKYQIKDAFALNFSADYNDLLIRDKNNRLDLTWVNSVNLGAVFTNVSTGFYGRFGLDPLQKIVNSIGFGSGLNNANNTSKKEKETFIYIKPTLRYTFYDATIEGSFLNKGSEVTKEVVPFVFNTEIGLLFSTKRFNWGYIINYNTNKSKGLKYSKGNTYGRILINYALY